jgi:hypothetical protein
MVIDESDVKYAGRTASLGNGPADAALGSKLFCANVGEFFTSVREGDIHIKRN